MPIPPVVMGIAKKVIAAKVADKLGSALTKEPKMTSNKPKMSCKPKMSGKPMMYGKPMMKGTFMSKCDKSKM